MKSGKLADFFKRKKFGGVSGTLKCHDLHFKSKLTITQFKAVIFFQTK